MKTSQTQPYQAAPATPPPSFALIPLEQIAPSWENPRKTFATTAMDELEASVRTHGVLQPILIRPLPTGLYVSEDLSEDKSAWRVWAGVPGDAKIDLTGRLGKAQATKTLDALRGVQFQLVAGERRFRAALAANLYTIPAMIRAMTDKAAAEARITENLNRQDLHPLEEAEFYEGLMRGHGYSVEELAARSGKSKAYVYARLKLTELVAPARKALAEDKINHSVALLLARIPDKKLQAEALEDVSEAFRGDPMGYREASGHIQQNFMLRLKDAPFDVRDAGLVPAAGPCGACPKRTGNQPELFGDVKSADVCTDPVCFQAKKAAHVAGALAKAKEAGHQVLEGPQAAKIFEYGHLSGRANKDYVEASERCDVLGSDSDRTWEMVTRQAKDLPTVLAADQNGTLHKLLPRTEAIAAIKAAGHKLARVSAPADPGRVRASAKNRERKAMALAASPKILSWIDNDFPKVARAVARAVHDVSDVDVHAFVAVRRGLAGNGLEAWLEKTTDERELLEFSLECLLCARWSQDGDFQKTYIRLCRQAGVNLKAIEKSMAKPTANKA